MAEGENPSSGSEEALERGQIVTQKGTSAGQDGNLHWCLVPFTYTHPQDAVNPYSRPSKAPLPPGFPQGQIHALWKCALGSKMVPEAILTLIKAGHAHTLASGELCIGRLAGVMGSLLEGLGQDSHRQDSRLLEAAVIQGLCSPPPAKSRVHIESNGLKTQHVQETEGILNSASLA